MVRARVCPIGAFMAAVACLLLAVPDTALAHGLQVRQDLPIPDWLFGWAAEVVLMVSFVALAVLWPRPRLQEEGWRPLPDGLSRVVSSRVLEAACGAIGVGLLLLVVYSGLRDTEIPTETSRPRSST